MEIVVLFSSLSYYYPKLVDNGSAGLVKLNEAIRQV